MKKQGLTLSEMYNSQIVIPMEDEPVHTDETPYCDDPECPCTLDYYAEMRKLHPFDEDTAFGNPEQDETGTHAPDCRCGWCEPQERQAYYDELAHEQLAREYRALCQDRNATTQTSDGSWW